MKICHMCKFEKTLDDFHKYNRSKDGKMSICKECNKNKVNNWRINNLDKKADTQRKYRSKQEIKNRRNILGKISRLKNPERQLFKYAKSRAKERNIEFTITKDDIKIPTHCPVLGLFLEVCGQFENAPTIDRLDSSKGYVKENIRVISKRANSLKKNATVEELDKIIFWLTNTLK